MSSKSSKRQKNSVKEKKTRQDKSTAKRPHGSLWLLLAPLRYFFGDLSKENALDWVRNLVVAGAIALTFRWAVSEPFKIPSGSMNPTLHGEVGFMKGDRVFVNKTRYGLRIPFMDKRIWRGKDPERFDIVVFHAIEKGAAHRTLVKRLIGLPGDRVHIEGGKIHINGDRLDMPEELKDVYYTTPFGWKYGILEDDAYSLIPEDHYFMLGDNSASSKDARAWGWVPNDNLLGRVSCIWFPFPNLRDFTGFTTTLWWRAFMAILAVLLVIRLFFGRSWGVLVRSGENDKGRVEHLYVNRFTLGMPIPFTWLKLYRGRQPKRGELVMYRNTSEDVSEEESLLIGRIAGFGGEELSVSDSQLLVNGNEVTDAPSLLERKFDFDESTGPYARSKNKKYSCVPDDHYFIVGESSEDGLDSRSLGWIPHDSLVGTVPAVWWPLTRCRRIRP